MLTDILADVLAHTHGLGFIEMVKITGDANETKIEAMNDARSVIMYSKLKTPYAGFEGTIGLARMGVLSGYLKFPPFQDPAAKVEIGTRDKGGVQVPAEVRFSATGGHASTYRFMSKEVVDEQIKVPTFRGLAWDVVLTPEAGSLKDLSYFAGILGSYEPTFSAKTEGTDFNLYIGSDSTDRVKVPFAKNVSGSLQGRWSWPLVETLAILKLANAADTCVMSFAEKGALKIDISSPVADYEYILPARQ